MGVDWTQLPPELVESIAKRLTIYADYLRFGVVCHIWRSAVPKTPTHLPPQLPWLMLPQSQPSQSHRAFFNLSNSKVHFLHLPEASNRKRRCGSSHGWLVILEETPAVLLVNPLTRAKRHLPPLSTFPNVARFDYADVGREYALQFPSGAAYTYTRSLTQMRDSFLKKVVLSSSPVEASGSKFTALAILSQTSELAFCREGDESWTFIDGAQSYSEDVISVNGVFYAVDAKGIVAVCNIEGPSPASVEIIPTPVLEDADIRYLVSSGADLLLVSRYLEIDYDFLVDSTNVNYRTVGFDVFRMNWMGQRWDKVENLGDRMVFIGANSSFSLSASDFPGSVGNCIYFTDDYSEANYEFDSGVGGYDSGIFRLWDGAIQELPPYPRNSNYQMPMPPGSLPLWVNPNPC